MKIRSKRESKAYEYGLSAGYLACSRANSRVEFTEVAYQLSDSTLKVAYFQGVKDGIEAWVVLEGPDGIGFDRDIHDAMVTGEAQLFKGQQEWDEFFMTYRVPITEEVRKKHG